MLQHGFMIAFTQELLAEIMQSIYNYFSLVLNAVVWRKLEEKQEMLYIFSALRCSGQGLLSEAVLAFDG